jgi:hypothetical protein
MSDRQIGNAISHGLLLVSVSCLVQVKRDNVPKLLRCSASNFVPLVRSERESVGQMVTVMPARMTPTASLTADLSPPVGQTSNKGQQQLSFTEVITCETASACQAGGDVPKTRCIASAATEASDGSCSRWAVTVGCCVNGVTVASTRNGTCHCAQRQRCDFCDHPILRLGSPVDQGLQSRGSRGPSFSTC